MRNITKSEDISALEKLSNICEPLKIYSRNAGGTEYETYAPFTLFADACNVDAKDAMEFNRLAKNYLADATNKTTTSEMLAYLNEWSKISDNLNSFENPIINTIKPIAENVQEVSKELMQVFSNKKITKTQEEKLQKLLAKVKEPVVDVEVAVLGSFEQLVAYAAKNFT